MISNASGKPTKTTFVPYKLLQDSPAEGGVHDPRDDEQHRDGVTAPRLF